MRNLHFLDLVDKITDLLTFTVTTATLQHDNYVATAS